MKNDRIRTVTRIVALLLAALMVGTGLISVLSVLVGAASNPVITRIDYGRSEAKKLQYNMPYKIYFEFEEASLPTGVPASFKTSGFRLNNAWASDSQITFEVTSLSNGDHLIKGTLEATYKSRSEAYELSITNIVLNGIGSSVYSISGLELTVPDEYFPDDSTGSGGGTEITSYTSQIVVENAVALDSSGNRIDEVTEDTPSFTLEITYADMGLQNADVDDLDSGDMQVFLKNGASFEIGSSTKGKLALTSKVGDYPRFRATFTDVTYTGTGKDIGFTAFYKFDDLDTSVSGEGTAILTAAKAKDEDEDGKKMGIPVPKIIISNYSYGEDTIEAGKEFNLAFTIQNTSTETPVENIVVTLTPASNEAATKGPGLIVASSSNTIYVPELAAGGAQSYNVAFQARPDAEVTSHLITVQFSYEYVDENLKTREKVPDLSESIAIPVSQVDRFVLEPILETVYAQMNEEAYLTVNFINRGKSSVNNIYGTIKIDNPAITAPGQAYGHLEAGKPDSLDMYLTSTEPGEFSGEVVIQYEDENNNVKELSTPFTLFVEEPWYPPMEEQLPPDGMEETEPVAQGPGVLNILMCVIGGIAIAVPIALYLMKRVRVKGSEEFDEDF